jgi:hypothetical protein
VARFSIVDFLARPTSKWKFICVIQPGEDYSSSNMRCLQHENWIERELGADFAMECSMYGFRIWLDDEDAATAFALYSSWPVMDVPGPRKYFEDPELEVKLSYDDTFKP